MNTQNEGTPQLKQTYFCLTCSAVIPAENIEYDKHLRLQCPGCHGLDILTKYIPSRGRSIDCGH